MIQFKILNQFSPFEQLVLNIINHKKQYTTSRQEFSEYTGITISGLEKILTRLKKDGYINWTRSKENCTYFLTAKGRKLFE